ncbi:hypothetical protein EPH95_15680 [Salicibibacter halophilus]|uniref:SCP domain-containing protein n=1 Tax=Salicibibacter halophilus TaxID=2502791 RepID=A0A514LKT5_9BACI|nr:CAP domain-containing protein [Salicibibacter halophilus]QDI92457.1 hypothetical protein EPH95_15680 [Salicibibacter halophilus]
MQKYLVALSAFLLVPAGAMAEEEDVRYIEGDGIKKAGVFGDAGSLDISEEDVEAATQTVEDKFKSICDELDLQASEDVDEDQANQDKPADDDAEENGQQEEQPEENNEGSNEEEGSDEQQEAGEGQVEGDDTEQNNDQSFETESEFEQEVIRLTNEEREAQGLEPLEADSEVSDVARVKSEDMRDNDYFSHDSPTYGSPFDMMDEYGLDYMGAGENIAAGQTSPEQVVEGWMDSDGHRANILNEDYTHIGVGHAEGGSYGEYWTQMFITE